MTKELSPEATLPRKVMYRNKPHYLTVKQLDNSWLLFYKNFSEGFGVNCSTVEESVTHLRLFLNENA